MKKIDSKHIIRIIVWFLFIGIGLTGLCIGVKLIMDMKALQQSSSKIEYLEKWTVTGETGESFETGRTYSNQRAYTEDFSIVSEMPKEIAPGDYLCFKNRSNCTVFIGCALRYDFDRIRDTHVPGGSLKEFYVTIPLNKSDSGCKVEIIRGSTDWNPVIVPETFVTTSEGLYSYISDNYGLSFILTVVLFISSLLVIIVGIVTSIWNKKTVKMLYAALGILDVACWLLSVSQVTPFLTHIYYADGILGFLFTLAMPFGLLVYTNLIQNRRHNTCHTLLFLLSLFNFVLWTALHFSGIQTFQQSLVYINSVLGLVVASVVVTILIDLKNRHIKEYPFATAGIIIFLSTSAWEITLLIFFQTKSNELPILIGLLCLLALAVVQQVDDNKKSRLLLKEEVRRKEHENEQMLIHIVQTLAVTIDAKDTYTNGHSSRVADYSREIARRCGMTEAQINDIYMMALLHDIGKIGVPDTLINKTSRLSDEEMAIVKKHPEIGAKIIKNIEEKPELEVGVRWHHERFDGKGYPDGLKGEEIPEMARIIAVADAYDAMTSYRSYRDPMPQDKVRSEIEKGSGTQFDARFAKVMLEIISEDKD